MKSLSLSAFSAKINHDTGTDPDYVALDGHRGGYLSLDAHVHTGTTISGEHHVRSWGRWSTVKLISDTQRMTLFFDDSDIDTMIATRDALTANIRKARKGGAK